MASGMGDGGARERLRPRLALAVSSTRRGGACALVLGAPRPVQEDR